MGMKQAKIWERMTVKEMREALPETPTVLIPLGVTEQHGYHLALNTDNHNAWQLCVRAADRTGSLVAPLLPYTFSGGELPGTLNIDYHVVSMMVSEILRALAANGVQNLVLVSGHGGSENDRATQEGAEMFVRHHPEYADRKVAVYRFWQVPGLIAEAIADGDYHAGYLETSLMLYWAPEDTRMDALTLDDPALVAVMRQNPDHYQSFSKPVDHPAVVARVGQRPEVQVGVMGDPSQASAELGERICGQAVEGLVELIEALEGRDEA